MAISRRQLAISGVYVFFLCGALWNTLQLFQPLMKAMTPVVLCAVAIAAWTLTYKLTLRNLAAGGVVIALTFVCEAAGVNLGFPFGDYSYTHLLGPKLLDVPIVIPFAWLSALVPSWVASERILRFKHVVVASIVVTAFDAVLEFAAESLDLWHWQGGRPTELNYISWFVISYLSLSFLKKCAEEKQSDPMVPHLLIAQLAYFALSDIGIRFIAL
jgi:putative membrane protein